MTSIRDWSIKHKLVLIIMMISSAAVVLACATFVAYELFAARQRMITDHTAQARMLVNNCVASVAFDDPKDAAEILESLRAKPTVAYACVLRGDGTLLARYAREGFTRDEPPAVPPEDECRFEDGWLVSTRPILLNDMPVGSVYLQSDLSELALILQRSAAAVAITLVVSMLVSYALAARLQRVISNPVLRLAQTARSVSEDKDYSVRATKDGNDELGLLIDAFNDMLSQIERHEAALRESEERFRGYFELGIVGMAIVSVDRRWVAFNDRLCEILGHSREELKRLTWDALTHPDDLPAEMERYTQVLADETDGYSLDKRFLRGDGRTVDAILSVRCVRGADGAIDHFIALVQDITERKRAEADREALIGDLENKNSELERFAYTVSHDLKSPLITISGFLGMVEQAAMRGDLDQVREDMARINHAAEKMRQLLDELLELSRIGRLVNPLEDIPFGELSREALELVAGRIAERGVDVRVAADLPVVYGDRARLLTVMQNLVENAVKYMGHQPEPVVEIGARTDGDDVVIFVRDNGIGIEARHREQVFGLFSKLERDSEGTGVGLALAKRIVEVHGGRIWVESKGRGHGSTFCFSLPLSRQMVH